jgi:magnesium transporter
MRQDSVLHAGALDQAELGAGNVAVYTNPTPEESRELLETLQIDEHTLASALDPDEISRIEHEGSQTFIIWKRPNNVSFQSLQMFEVSSIGIFMRPDRLTLVMAEATPPFAERRGRSATALWDLVLQLLLGSVHHYLGHLKVIKMIARELQAKLATSMANEYLLKMFALSESLTYYLNAIEANGGVLARLRMIAPQVGLTAEQVRLLDDIIIENTQCARQTDIYTTVLAGLMDARGNIINNNMNVLLKNLTLVNVVFLPLGVLAGIGGMSEFSMMTQGIDWRIAYSLFLVGLVALGIVLWMVLNRWVARPRPEGLGGK